MTRSERKFATMFNFAEALATLSTCKRAQVGATIFPMDCSSVYAIGYNGPPVYHPNDSCTEVVGGCGCAHAEANALVKCSPVLMRPSVMYSTTLPCLHCATLICNCLPIVVLIFYSAYREGSAKVMSDAGIEMIHRSRVHDVTIHKWRALSSRGR